MKKLKPSRPPKSDARKIVITFKVSAEEMKELIKRTHGLAGGNMSEYLRYVAMNFKPAKEDFEK